MSSTIAVIIPAYNADRFIARSVKSVIRQTRPADEIVVVDDASQDATAATARSVDSGSVAVISHPGNRGEAAARNTGIARSKSEWVAFLDADDEWDPGFLEEIERLIGAAPPSVGMVFTGYRIVGSDGQPQEHPFTTRTHRLHPSPIDIGDFATAWIRDGSPPMCSDTVVVRRTLIESAGAFPEGVRRGADTHTWVRWLAATTASYSPKALAVYHRQPGSVTFATPDAERPVLADLIPRVIPAVDPRHCAALRRLCNIQMYRTARAAVGTTRLPLAMTQNFYVRDSPGQYALLMAFIALPPVLFRATRALGRRLRVYNRG